MSLERTVRAMNAKYPQASTGWKDDVYPIGAISGRTPDVPVQVSTRSRRTGVERLELVAAGIGGALALAALIYVEKKVTGRA